jgi:NNP family nitrate/nitrite transporter-like MFS transporter
VVWFYWSVLVLYHNDVGYALSGRQVFTLMATPMLSGASLRIAYSFVVPIVGGRNWTVISTASLLVPTIGIGLAVQNPATPYPVLLFLSVCCGLGGGNFASSMANIQAFFPKRYQGVALGANAGLGNLGVSMLQLLAPMTMGLALYEPLTGGGVLPDGATEPIFVQNIVYIWIAPILLATVGAWFWTNSLEAPGHPLREQVGSFRSKHLYVVTILYTMSFGSFVGFSALFPLLSKMYFPGTRAQSLAFIGPLVGSLIRPLGGFVADRVDGGRVTLWTTAVKTAAALGVIHFLPTESRSFIGFFLTFLVVFLMSGVANASIFKMVPSLFPATQVGTVLGFSSAIASYGAFLLPMSFNWSLERHGSVTTALWWIVAFYVACMVLMWWYYVRRDAPDKC